ncbi:heme-binding domain-containing protein [uncultured Draconibacterium sp.]|uniref:heme-binding domain-containing protein n=1 Tax=uncultured Draconibacterium sp. TaxID=1573823 RepID=UPI0025DE52C1|nr:heme-binding domain-containing protein [uncultured Draconibacterium sp.]
MKKSFFLFVSVFVIVSFIAIGSDKPEKKSVMPENVKAVIDKSCFGCHNTDSKNEDGKDALDFKKLESLSKIKQISAYKEISEVVEENDMPPKKFLERFPEKALSDADKKVLIEWSKKEAETLVKGI